MQCVHQLCVYQLAGAGDAGVHGAEISSQSPSWLSDSADTAAGCRGAVGTEMKWKWQHYLLRQVGIAQGCEQAGCQVGALSGMLLLKRFSDAKRLATNDTGYSQMEELIN